MPHLPGRWCSGASRQQNVWVHLVQPRPGPQHLRAASWPAGLCPSTHSSSWGSQDLPCGCSRRWVAGTSAAGSDRSGVLRAPGVGCAVWGSQSQSWCWGSAWSTGEETRPEAGGPAPPPHPVPGRATHTYAFGSQSSALWTTGPLPGTVLAATAALGTAPCLVSGPRGSGHGEAWGVHVRAARGH